MFYNEFRRGFIFEGELKATQTGFRKRDRNTRYEVTNLKNDEGTCAVINIIAAGVFVVTVMHSNAGRDAAGLCAVFKS